MNNTKNILSDEWSDWLLHYRHGGDPELGHFVSACVDRYAERVLDGAQLSPEMTLADIGTGEGLIAFRAIDRIGPSLHVILTDISAPMLRHAEKIAIQRGVDRQCTYLQCSAENIKDIDDESVDVVTIRSALAYVSYKDAALLEFKRILKPGGRISLAEPVLRDDALMASALRKMIDDSPHGTHNRLIYLLHRWKSAQFPDTDEKISANPITNYSERDLVQLAHNCGFVDIHMELHIDIGPSTATPWEVFINTAPHPLAPSLSVILDEQFTAEEREFLEQILRPTIESTQAVVTERIAYLTARKPFSHEHKETTALFHELLNDVKA